MKKSSSGSKRRERSKSPLGDSKSKKIKPRSKSKEREKAKGDNKQAPRKSRWQAADKEVATKSAEIPKEPPGPAPRIRDCLHDKEKIVDLLFQTVTGAALQDLIPDYLKNRSLEELKRLCLQEIKSMTNEVILDVISGKVDSSNKDEEKNVEKEQILKLEQPSPAVKEEKKEEVVEQEEKPVEKPMKESLKNVPESPKTSGSNVESLSEEDNVIPLVIKDEIARDLIQPERDAELLELEMRARAIRSLLKSKTQSASENEIKEE